MHLMSSPGNTSRWAIAALLLSACGSADAAVMSFNAVGAATGGMTASDVAGAPGAEVANWNKMASLQTSAGGAISGAIAAGGLVNDAGAVQALTAITWSGTGVANAAGGGTNHQKMFESEWDLFDSGSNTAVADMTISVTGIPYALYDVYFYVQDGNNASPRGGEVTANGKTEAIRMFDFPASNPAGNFGYVEVDSTAPFSTTATPQGTFLRIQDLTGDLALSISSKNPTTPRLRFSGFQIVQVPEPSSVALAGVTLTGLLGVRRRRH